MVNHKEIRDHIEGCPKCKKFIYQHWTLGFGEQH